MTLSVTGSLPVDLKTMGAYFGPVSEWQELRLERTLLELGDVAAGYADHVMVVLG
jgi:hypothetical protein